MYRGRVRAAAIVNGTARRVGARLRTQLARAFPAVVFTRSLDEARQAIRAAVARGVDFVALGGGDGTIVMGLALIEEACRGLGRPEPAIGVLRLGSGNAIASAVGASRDPAADLARLVRGEGTWRSLRMIRALGVRAPFVGVGVDAQLLEDQVAVGRVVDRVPGGRFIGGGARYALSIALRSMPRFAAAARPRAVISNLGAPAIAVARGGPTGREIARGAELWSGACTLVAGATIPYFGFGLKMFAFAGSRADRFQLRCGDVGLLELVRRAPSAFRGDYFADNVSDFLCDHVQIQLDAEVAIEAGGELLGRGDRFELALCEPVTIVALANDP